MILLRLVIVTALFVGAARGSVRASDRCVQRTLTADMLPGPERWHELPNATYEVHRNRLPIPQSSAVFVDTPYFWGHACQAPGTTYMLRRRFLSTRWSFQYQQKAR